MLNYIHELLPEEARGCATERVGPWGLDEGGAMLTIEKTMEYD